MIFGISFKILIKNIRQPHSRYFMLSFSSWASNYIIFYIFIFFKSAAWKILFIEIYDLRNAFSWHLFSSLRLWQCVVSTNRKMNRNKRKEKINQLPRHWDWTIVTKTPILNSMLLLKIVANNCQRQCCVHENQKQSMGSGNYSIRNLSETKKKLKTNKMKKNRFSPQFLWIFSIFKQMMVLHLLATRLLNCYW